MLNFKSKYYGARHRVGAEDMLDVGRSPEDIEDVFFYARAPGQVRDGVTFRAATMKGLCHHAWIELIGAGLLEFLWATTMKNERRVQQSGLDRGDHRRPHRELSSARTRYEAPAFEPCLPHLDGDLERGSILIGALVFHDSIAPPHLVFIVLLIVGIVGASVDQRGVKQTSHTEGPLSKKQRPPSSTSLQGPTTRILRFSLARLSKNLSCQDTACVTLLFYHHFSLIEQQATSSGQIRNRLALHRHKLLDAGPH